jgi:hypothetical protein
MIPFLSFSPSTLFTPFLISHSLTINQSKWILLIVFNHYDNSIIYILPISIAIYLLSSRLNYKPLINLSLLSILLKHSSIFSYSFMDFIYISIKTYKCLLILHALIKINILSNTLFSYTFLVLSLYSSFLLYFCWFHVLVCLAFYFTYLSIKGEGKIILIEVWHKMSLINWRVFLLINL